MIFFVFFFLLAVLHPVSNQLVQGIPDGVRVTFSRPSRPANIPSPPPLIPTTKPTDKPSFIQGGSISQVKHPKVMLHFLNDSVKTPCFLQSLVEFTFSLKYYMEIRTSCLDILIGFMWCIICFYFPSLRYLFQFSISLDVVFSFYLTESQTTNRSKLNYTFLCVFCFCRELLVLICHPMLFMGRREAKAQWARSLWVYLDSKILISLVWSKVIILLFWSLVV